MSHALASRACSLPLAASCRGTVQKVKGIIGTGISTSNRKPSTALQKSIMTSAAQGATEHESTPQSAARSATNGAGASPAAAADIRTMLIDLDDCLYDIHVSPPLPSRVTLTAERRNGVIVQRDRAQSVRAAGASMILPWMERSFDGRCFKQHHAHP
jgi:hypothetical protein